MTEEKSLTLRETLVPETFDPMSIDQSEFRTLIDQMPQDTNIDVAIAEKLAAQYLRAADRCSEIHSALIHCVQERKLEKNLTRQKLYLLAKDEGYKTVADRQAYAESHDDYVEVSRALLEAETVKSWFEDKHKWFLKSHQFMKDKLKAELQHMRSAGFSETVDASDKKWGEKKEW